MSIISKKQTENINSDNTDFFKICKSNATKGDQYKRVPDK